MVRKYLLQLLRLDVEAELDSSTCRVTKNLPSASVAVEALAHALEVALGHQGLDVGVGSVPGVQLERLHDVAGRCVRVPFDDALDHEVQDFRFALGQPGHSMLSL